jgi:hypothetical protein
MDERGPVNPNDLDAAAGIGLSHLHRTLRSGLSEGFDAANKDDGDALLRSSYRDLIQADADLKESVDALTVAMGGTPARDADGTSAAAKPNSVIPAIQSAIDTATQPTNRRTDELASAAPLRDIAESVHAANAPVEQAPAPAAPQVPQFANLFASLGQLGSIARAPQESRARTIANTVSHASPVVRELGQLFHPHPHVPRVPAAVATAVPHSARPVLPEIRGTNTQAPNSAAITGNTQALAANTQALQALTTALVNEAQTCGCKPGSGQRGTASIPSIISVPSIGAPSFPTGTADSSIGFGSIPDVSSTIRYGGEVPDSAMSGFAGIPDVSSSINYGGILDSLSSTMGSTPAVPDLGGLFSGGSGNDGLTPNVTSAISYGGVVPDSAIGSTNDIFASGGALPASGLQRGIGIASGLTKDVESLFGGNKSGTSGTSGIDSLFGGSGGTLGQSGSDSVMNEFGITSGDLDQLTGPSAGPDAEMPGLSAAKTGGLSLGGVLGAAGGTLQAVKGFEKGGGQGIASGIGGTLEAAGAIATMIPGGQLIGAGLEVAGLAASLVSSLFGDPRKNYSDKETRQIENAQQAAFPYTQPGLHIDESTSGHVTTTDFQGNIQELNAIPTVGTETRAAGFDPLHPDHLIASSIRTVNDLTPTGTVDLFHPEATTTGTAASYAPSPTSYVANTPAPAASVGDMHIHLPIAAMDSQDVMRRSKDIATAVQMAILNSNHPLARSILDRVNPR